MKRIIRNNREKVVNDTEVQDKDTLRTDYLHPETTVLFHQLVGYDKCPYCDSLNTFHREMTKLKMPNVIPVQAIENGLVVFLKLDECLDCNKRFVGQVFVHKLKQVIHSGDS